VTGAGRAIGSVRAIARHPVKSMGGESIGETEILRRFGVAGDRAWAIRDVAAGEIRGAKKIPELLQLSARSVEAPHGERSQTVEIDLGNGQRVRSDEPDASKRLSERIGRALELCPRLPADAKAHYRRARPITDPEREIREASLLLPEEAIPSGAAPPVDLSICAEYVSPPGTYFDFFDLHLMSTRSLASFAACVPDSLVDARRFRPNLVVELEPPRSGEASRRAAPPAANVDDASAPDLERWPELGWVGTVLAVGDARLEITMPMMRCGMTTQAQPQIPKDPRIMRALVRDCGMDLGVGVTVVRAGKVRVGDAIRIAGA